MKNQWRLVLVLLLALVIVIFAILNVDPVTVNFAFGTAKWPLIIVIIVSLLLGALVTVLVSTMSALGLRRQVKALTAEKKQQDIAVDQAVATATAKLNTQLAEKEDQINALQQQTSAAASTESGAK
ncbi:LapA family protein [Loigolactobacillus jiayinensis]|uniref:Lipopolysaccharide assembly LapA domain-containing protein n=1 Tax=Loigolactobacillus jiayinensis TaxID=2486016 RepID=A0ABW1RD86_9LACO|nr:LapA family protein [Loigolactobacillus jiayinensis]